LEDEAMAKVLIVAEDEILPEIVRRELPVERQFKVGVAASGFEAGIPAQSLHPDCLIVHFSIVPVQALQFCQNLRRIADFADSILAEAAGSRPAVSPVPLALTAQAILAATSGRCLVTSPASAAAPS